MFEPEKYTNISEKNPGHRTLRNLCMTFTWEQEWNPKANQNVSASDARNIYNDILNKLLLAMFPIVEKNGCINVNNSEQIDA